ncbi:Histidinol dehydrogenase [Fulvivirga imtechensis AK7]|uniref:Histidinol dehydrogenase n=1 Tax=Fulvivirga imtechensis AK7 TaxID=1237149 RepID=L8JPK3_9BACT|nr:histidinol dehydrogenase [Fulvivirga imtechensis]ELR70891.1 Histidinol dehydrogenase [Fulvivirga imtechensis AK7]
MNIIKYPNPSELEELLKRPSFEADYLESIVKNIITRVRQCGDQALFELNEKFDKVKLDTLIVSKQEFDAATNAVSDELKNAIQVAAENILKFHSSQKRVEKPVETSQGVTCWRKAVAIEKVGIYIPGGTAPLFSTVLMLAIPATIAGCSEIILCTPPDREGSINSAILYAAQLTGVTKVYKVGGAQAIAAMAYGTESIPKADKIFGPGNQYVTAAKQMVSLDGVAIDMPAGPSELAIIADASANPAFIAADLLSQAEHGRDSQVILFGTDEYLIKSVNEEMQTQIRDLPRKEIAKASLSNSKAILVKDINEALKLSNYYAPEHLIIATENAEDAAEKVLNAGSVFLGNYTPESAGDYASGTNHTLPTNGTARAYSGVSLDSFVKQITFQKITQAGIQNLGPAIEQMAEAEQLLAHKRAVTIRMA